MNENKDEHCYDRYPPLHSHHHPKNIYLKVNLPVPVVHSTEPCTNNCKQAENARKITMISKELSFSLGRTIRYDTYAKIKLATSTAYNQKIDVKCVQKKSSKLRDYMRFILPRELAILKLLKGHPNVVQFIGMIETEKYVLLATEHVDHVTLLQYIVSKEFVDEKEAMTIFREILNTVATCHSLGISIRGLSSENVLLYKNMMPVLTNFEHAIVKGYNMVDLFEGVLNSPPEVSRDRECEPELIDVWMLGVILYTMVTGMYPFDTKPKEHYTDEPLYFPARVSSECRNVIAKMLHCSPDERISVSELKRDVWVSNFTLTSVSYNPEFDVKQKKACVDRYMNAGVKVISKKLTRYKSEEKCVPTVGSRERSTTVTNPNTAVSPESSTSFKVWLPVQKKLVEAGVQVQMKANRMVNKSIMTRKLPAQSPPEVAVKSVTLPEMSVKGVMTDEPLPPPPLPCPLPVMSEKGVMTDESGPPPPPPEVVCNKPHGTGHITQYLLLAAPTTKMKVLGKGRESVYYKDVPASVDVKKDGSAVKLTLVLNDEINNKKVVKEFTSPIAKTNQAPCPLSVKSNKEYLGGDYTIQQFSEDADDGNNPSSSYRVNLDTKLSKEVREVKQRGKFYNVVSRMLPRLKKSGSGFKSLNENAPRQLRKHSSMTSRTSSRTKNVLQRPRTISVDVVCSPSKDSKSKIMKYSTVGGVGISRNTSSNEEFAQEEGSSKNPTTLPVKQFASGTLSVGVTKQQLKAITPSSSRVVKVSVSKNQLGQITSLHSGGQNEVSKNAPYRKSITSIQPRARNLRSPSQLMRQENVGRPRKSFGASLSQISVGRGDLSKNQLGQRASLHSGVLVKEGSKNAIVYRKSVTYSHNPPRAQNLQLMPPARKGHPKSGSSSGKVKVAPPKKQPEQIAPPHSGVVKEGSKEAAQRKSGTQSSVKSRAENLHSPLQQPTSQARRNSPKLISSGIKVDLPKKQPQQAASLQSGSVKEGSLVAAQQKGVVPSKVQSRAKDLHSPSRPMPQAKITKSSSSSSYTSASSSSMSVKKFSPPKTQPGQVALQHSSAVKEGSVVNQNSTPPSNIQTGAKNMPSLSQPTSQAKIEEGPAEGPVQSAPQKEKNVVRPTTSKRLAKLGKRKETQSAQKVQEPDSPKETALSKSEAQETHVPTT